jgi:hypothetical protein
MVVMMVIDKPFRKSPGILGIHFLWGIGWEVQSATLVLIIRIVGVKDISPGEGRLLSAMADRGFFVKDRR